jgi:molybdopterin synthase sulfur carrier subunit
MKKIKVLAFGPLVEIIEKEFFIEAADTEKLLASLIRQFPLLENRKLAVAVNGKITKDVVLLQESDTVALLPPYSGG